MFEFFLSWQKAYGVTFKTVKNYVNRFTWKKNLPPCFKIVYKVKAFHANAITDDVVSGAGFGNPQIYVKTLLLLPDFDTLWNLKVSLQYHLFFNDVRFFSDKHGGIQTQLGFNCPLFSIYIQRS